MAMQLDYQSAYAELWKLATGKDPDNSAEYVAFARAVVKRLEGVRDIAWSEASTHVACWSPIDPEGMTPAYKRAFEETKRGCAKAIEELRTSRRD